MRSLRSVTEIIVLALAGPSLALAATTHHVTVQNYDFIPKDIVVQVGDTVQWDWVSGDHTVANGANPFEAGAGTLFNHPMDVDNQTFSWVVVDAPGLLNYHCGPHWFAGMTGTIDIQPVPAARYDVVVRDYEFDPPLVGIASGDTVCWKWESGTHTTTSGASSNPVHNPGALWNAVIDSGNQTFCYVFSAPGLYPYFCANHEDLGMTGVVAVDEPTTGLPDDGFGTGPRLSAPFPNPSSRTHNMRLTLNTDAMVKMDIYDLQGRKVYSLPEQLMTQGDNMLRWAGETSLGAAAGPGMYLVRVQAGSKVLLAKLFRASGGHMH